MLERFLELVGPAVCATAAGLILAGLVLGLTLEFCWRNGIDPTADPGETLRSWTRVGLDRSSPRA